jgi:CheY-like chemotaxis protein
MPAPACAILVVDDDEVSAMRVRQSLEAAGYQVASVTSAAEAVQRIDEVVPRVVVLDLGLPEGTSFQLMHHLRAMPMWREVPIIAVASIQRIEDVQRAIRIGATDFITKPVNPDALLDRVKRRVGRNA